MRIKLSEQLSQIPGSPRLKKALEGMAAVVRIVVGPTWTAVVAASTEEQSLAVPGVEVGDFVVVAKPTLQAGIAIGSSRVSAKNTVQVTWINSTAATAVTPTAAEMYKVLHVSMGP